MLFPSDALTSSLRRGGWEWTSLSSVAQLESGHTPSRKHPEYWDGGIPWIGIKDATENHGRTLTDTYQHVSELGLENSSARLLPANTICLSRTASVGFVVVMGRPMATSQDFVNWVCGPNIEPHYLKYVLLAENESLWRFASGTTHQTIYYPEAKAFHVCLPPLAEQKAIAAVLGALDDKIELNRRMNATLEAMARALFQSWFVDFDPIRAKLDGRQPHGLDPATAALFPSTFEDSSLGPIPHGWTATTLPKACEQGGGSIQTGPFGTQLHAADYVNEGVPSIMPSDLRDNRIEPESISRIREQDAERLKTYRVQAGDVVYSRRGDVERRSLIRHSENGWLCGTGCLRIRFGPRGLNPFFGASYLGTLESRAWVVRHAVGATMPNLNTSILGALPMIAPPSELQSRFAEIVGPWDERGTIALEQSRTLATLRDTLLPKLLSGELSVRSASATVDAAA
jgi:type I restriction enzyme, S subunit